MNIKWDAEEYKNNFSFVHKYGEDVLNLINAPQGSLVVDLGCGNGALTKKLADMSYKVIGIDSADSMLDIAKAQNPDLDFRCEDALRFSLEEKADVIFSNAVFHWIDDQDALAANIYDQLKPGGQLVCEFGGKGNCERIHSALEREFNKRGMEYKRTFYFPSIGEHSSLLEKHGLNVTYAVLFDRMTEQKGNDGVADWIRMFVKVPFEGLNEELSNEIIKDAVDALKPELYIGGKWYADYVRIRLKAVKQ